MGGHCCFPSAYVHLSTHVGAPGGRGLVWPAPAPGSEPAGSSFPEHTVPRRAQREWGT